MKTICDKCFSIIDDEKTGNQHCDYCPYCKKNDVPDIFKDIFGLNKDE